MINKEKLIRELEKMSDEYEFELVRPEAIINKIIDNIKKGKYEVLCSDAHDVEEFYKD